jgi:hypothetical protein
MNMLRDFVYNPDEKLIIEALKQFDFKVPTEKGGLALTRFEVLTPDSFMWRIFASEVYYLYAEDYVPGLQYITSVFNSYLDSKEWEFIKPRHVKKFEQSTPVLTANNYPKLPDGDEMMNYAAESGYDRVFLVRSKKEDPDWALFSDYAPRGYLRTHD